MADVLNKRQKRILLLGLALLALSELVPYWLFFDVMTSGKRSAGYHFFTKNPKVEGPAEMLKLFPDHLAGDDVTKYIEVKRDGFRTFLQRLFLSLFTLALIILFKYALSFGWKILAVLIICLGIPPFYFWSDSLRFDYLISR